MRLKKYSPVLLALAIFLAGCAGASNRSEKSPASATSAASSAQTPTFEAVAPNAQTSTPEKSSLPSEAPAPLASPASASKSFQPQLAQVDIPLDEVVTLLPRDAIPAILPDEADEIMVSAEYANDNGLDPEERVIGVSINGENRAYPIPFLSRHEIVNTEIGGRLAAVTW